MRCKSAASNKKIISLDFFCGCGGVTHGFRRAGIKVLAGFDNDIKVEFAYKRNNKGSKFYETDINNKETVIKLVKKILKPYDPKNTISIFCACAPCQPFSAHNKNYKNRNDYRRNLMSSFIGIIAALPKRRRPSFVFVENVGPMKSRGKAILNKIINTLKSAEFGYDVLEPKIINAADFGVPQNRKRLIFIATKRQIVRNSNGNFKWDYFFERYRDNVVKVGEVIRGLPPIKAGTKVNKNDPLHITCDLSELNLKRIKQITLPGGSRNMWSKKDNLECYKEHKGHMDVYGRMSWEAPAPTLTCKCISLSNGRFGHPEQHRAISLREAAILQSMDDYVFQEPIIITKVARQIGNAVPPRLAEKFGLFIRELISS